MSKLLSREEIFKVNDIRTETVEVPEWQGRVKVKSMTGAERDAFEQSLMTQNGRMFNANNIRAKLVAKTVVDEDGKPLFIEADVETLGEKSSSALDRIFSTAQRLSGMTQKDIDELTKN